MSRMTPFTAPTKGSLVPKSVVRVMIGRCGNFSSLEDRIIPVNPKLLGGEGNSQGTEVTAESRLFARGYPRSRKCIQTLSGCAGKLQTTIEHHVTKLVAPPGLLIRIATLQSGSASTP